MFEFASLECTLGKILATLAYCLDGAELVFIIVVNLVGAINTIWVDHLVFTFSLIHLQFLKALRSIIKNEPTHLKNKQNNLKPI